MANAPRGARYGKVAASRRDTDRLQKPLEIPPGCEALLVLQRTQYQSALRRLLRKIGRGDFYDRHLAGIVDSWRHARIERLYEAELTPEFARRLPPLPAAPRHVLDIGCGLAGIDAWIYHACGKPALCLLDREGRSEVYYGFRADAAFYNSLALARRLLEMNGVPAGQITTVDVDTQPLPRNRRFDLVISLLSWGFHYPLDTYLHYVKAQLTDDGAVIVDTRRDTGGYDTLIDQFDQVTVVEETPKLQRLKVVGARRDAQDSISPTSSSG